MVDESLFDVVSGIICLGTPAVILATALRRPPRKLYIDEWMSLLTMPMTLFEMGLLGCPDPLTRGGYWFYVSIWVRLTYCMAVFWTSLAFAFQKYPDGRRSSPGCLHCSTLDFC